MNAKHTPGPWIACHTSVIVESNNEVVCLCEPRIKTGCEPANARLIAAAPELLEALKDAVSNLELQSDCISEAEWIASDEKAVWEKARTAIARAEGKDSP